MNILVPPPDRLVPDSEMDPDQLQTVVELIEELCEFGTVVRPPDDRPVPNNAPLFLVPNEGQPGQWRVIANAKESGLNACIEISLPMLRFFSPSQSYSSLNVLRGTLCGGGH
jgi:hypothetical protein